LNDIDYQKVFDRKIGREIEQLRREIDEIDRQIEQSKEMK
jgi:hypothetical protein